MPQWREMRRLETDGLTVVVDERMDRRNRHGATEYIIRVERGGKLLRSERHTWNVWAGHCSGSLLISEVVARAKRDAPPAAA